MFDQVPDGPERILNTYWVTVCNEGIGGISGPVFYGIHIVCEIVYNGVCGFPMSAVQAEV